jgi:hypothetical protein
LLEALARKNRGSCQVWDFFGDFYWILVVFGMVSVTPPSRNDGVNHDHVEGFSVKQEFISTCIEAIIIVFWIGNYYNLKV